MPYSETRALPSALSSTRRRNRIQYECIRLRASLLAAAAEEYWITTVARLDGDMLCIGRE